MALSQLHVTSWNDNAIEKRGYPADSGFVELFWLPVLRPSATFLFRRLNWLLETFPEGVTVEMNELGRELGLGPCESKHAFTRGRSPDWCGSAWPSTRPRGNWPYGEPPGPFPRIS